MPLPMIHLSIAIQMSADDPRCATPDFLLGSIAPDSIHMRPGSTRADKANTHLEAEGERFADTTAVETLVRHYALTPMNDFVLGYAAHILTDNLWIKTVIDPWRENVPTTQGTDAERKLYYGETDQVDFNIYHSVSWRPAVWQKLAQAVPVDLPPLLSAAEIDGWRVRTLRWFEDPAKEPGITPQYITNAVVQGFIEGVAPQVALQLRQWDSET